MMSVIMLNVVMLNVVMLNIVAPKVESNSKCLVPEPMLQPLRYARPPRSSEFETSQMFLFPHKFVC